MKKRLVRVVCLFVCALLCFPVVLVSAEYKTDDGMDFAATELNRTDRVFSEIPLTYEAWVYVPKSVSGRAGVVFGNYQGSKARPSINFEIHKNGRPRMYFVDKDQGVYDVTFSCDVRTGKYAHVAVACDMKNSTAYCYIDGKLAETKNIKMNADPECLSKPFLLGADYRSGNGQYFKGRISSVSVYSTVRSAAQIASDAKGSASASEAIAYFEIGGDSVKDLSSGGYRIESLQTWIDTKEPVGDYAYSMCVIGDTQKVVYNDPEKLSSIYDWILDNQDEKKIKYVFGLGDITDKNTAAEWLCAKNQISRLDGKVPYSLVRGNHDGSANYNSYLGTAEYKESIGGSYAPGKIENTWREFVAGGVPYLNITLDYGASDVVLNWAANVIKEHPEHRVIISTHAYLFRDGTTLDVGDVCPPNASGANDGKKNNGDQMWDKFISQHENIFLVLSGHDPCDDIIATQTKGVHGNTVTQFLIDPQGVDSAQGATGMIAMLYFSEDGEHITVENYSTVKKQYYMSTSQFTLTVPKYTGELLPEPEQSTPAETDSAPEDSGTVSNDPAETSSADDSTPAPSSDKGMSSTEIAILAVSLVVIAAAAAAIAVLLKGKKK